MRELDLLLEKFLASELESLADDDLDCLESLLEQPDQDILTWITSETKPEDARILRMVRVLRAHGQLQSNPDD